MIFRSVNNIVQSTHHIYPVFLFVQIYANDSATHDFTKVCMYSLPLSEDSQIYNVENNCHSHTGVYSFYTL